MDPEGREQVTVEIKRGEDIIKLPWKQYLKEYVNDSQHELIRKNVLTATRNFQHRVETFRREIIFGRNNPMCVRHISYRVEFQGRGAGHIHGVLWLDLKAIKVPNVDNSDLQKGLQPSETQSPVETQTPESIGDLHGLFCHLYQKCYNSWRRSSENS